MIKKDYLWRLLFDLNLCLTGAAAYKWITLGNSAAFLYPVSATLLIIADLLYELRKNGHINTLLRR